MKARPASSRVWVLPNRHTLGLGAVLLAMWYAGASQTNGAAYLLCFLLAAVAAVSIPQAWANLRGLEVRSDAIRPVFAGEELHVPLEISSAVGRSHGGVLAQINQLAAVPCGEIPARGSTRLELRQPTERRGLFPGLTFRLESRFPLGFFTASRSVTLAQPYHVYPAPEGTRPLPKSPETARERRDGLQVEGDDFAGVRPWRVGESQRHIDWKAAARGQALLIKQWAGAEDTVLHLDWESLHGLEPEARLSQLARWIIQAERTGSEYGLRLPGVAIAQGRGEAHHHRCLRALAEFPA